MLARLGVGWYRLRKFCLRVSPAANMQEKLQRCFSPGSDRFFKKIRVLIGPEAHGPVCFGLIRPVITLPSDIVRNSSAEEIKMIMNHELAHIKRHDNWMILLQRMIEAVFFFHPVADIPDHTGAGKNL